MTILDDTEALAQESRNSAIRAVVTLFKSSKGFSTDLAKSMVDSIITAAMMEISAMQIKIVEKKKREEVMKIAK